MYEYITGILSELTPASAVVECNGTGYFVNISLTTYADLNGKKQVQIFLHQVIREDAHVLFGFASRQERELFRQLISVSGVGPNTARMMLSSVAPDEIIKAISGGNVMLLKGIKGIGQKTAERIVVDLRDKIAKAYVPSELFAATHNTSRNEALSALVMLGFAKANIEKVLDKLLSGTPSSNAEDLVKQALKLL